MQKFGQPGAPGAPTFKQVIIDKGKKMAEGSKIPGSSATRNRVGNDELLSGGLTEETVEGSARKFGISLEQPSQGVDPLRKVADLNNNAHQGADIGRSGDSGGNGAHPKFQG